MFSDIKNDNKINENNLSKSLSQIEANNSKEDNNQISISESNDMFNYPTPKKMLSEMTQLSKRIREEEYDIENNNLSKIGELRTKYFPNKSNTKYSSIKQNYFNTIFNKDKINIRLKSMYIDKYNQIKNKIIDKNILKPNKNLKSFNNAEKRNDLNIDKNNDKITVFDLSRKNNFFIELLNEDCNFMDNIKQITKNELLKVKSDKEKIVILLDKNQEIIDILRKIEEKYKILKKEYIELYKKIISGKNNEFIIENTEYEKYILKQNETMTKKIDIYDKYFLPMTNYIDDISKIFNIKKINFLEIKQNINNSRNNTFDEDFNSILNENIKIINKIMKEYIIYSNNSKWNIKLLNKKGKRIFK